MKKYDRMAAVLLILIGIGTGYSSWRLRLGSMHHPDSGFLPFLASLLLVISSFIWLLSRLGTETEGGSFFETKGGWIRPVLSLLMLCLYAWAFEPVGYVVSTLIFMAAWQLVIERAKWLRAVTISVIATAVMWVAFVYLLTVPVPAGILGYLN